ADALCDDTMSFNEELSCSCVLGDLMYHVFDLAQYIVGKIDSVTATNGIFIQQRPLPSAKAAIHFSQGSDDAPKGEVENEVYTAVLGRFDCGTLGVFVSGRSVFGHRSEYIDEVWGT